MGEMQAEIAGPHHRLSMRSEYSAYGAGPHRRNSKRSEGSAQGPGPRPRASMRSEYSAHGGGFLPRFGGDGFGLRRAAVSLQQLLRVLSDKEPPTHPVIRVTSPQDSQGEPVGDRAPQCRSSSRSSSLPALANSRVSTPDPASRPSAKRASIFGGGGFPATPFRRQSKADGLQLSEEAGRLRTQLAEAAAKHSEDRARAAELLREREGELGRARAQHSEEIWRLRVQHARELEEARPDRKKEAAQELGRARMQHSEEISRLRAQHALELEEARSDRKKEAAQELGRARVQHAEEVSRLRAQHTRELEETRSDRKEEVERELLELTAERDALLEQAAALGRTGAQRDDTEVSQLRATHAAELQKAQRRAESTLTELDSLKAEVVALHLEVEALQAQASELTRSKSQASVELASMKSQRQREVQRLEAEASKQLEDYDDFVKRLVVSSALPSLKREFDLETSKVLGMGNIGFVFTCKAKATGDQAVLKVQGEKRAGATAKEWAHGSTLTHRHIVKYLDVFMHSDAERSVNKILEAAFDAGVLTGKRPCTYPRSYFCLSIEYMDHGTVQHLMDGGHCTLEAVAAITRQVASALAYMHGRQRTHNDVKPANILLQASAGDSCLVAKLADFGLAEHSRDTSRDSDLFGYTVWCMGLGYRFKRCPRGPEREAAVKEFRGRVPGCQQDRRLAGALAEVVGGMWEGTTTMVDVAGMGEFEGLEVKVPGAKGHAAASQSAAPAGR